MHDLRQSAALALVSLLSACAAHAADSRARALLGLALDAQGGEQKLRAIRNVQWEAAGYRNELEQSERPEGPYVTEFLSISETDDFEHGRYRNRTETNVYPFYKSVATTVVDKAVAMRSGGGAFAAGTPQQSQLAHERIALAPERILLTALDAADAHSEADSVLQSMPHNVVAFTLDGAPVRIFLNPYTHLPTAVDYAGPLAQSGFWAYLGAVTLRTWYGAWWLAKDGIHIPLQRNSEANGMPDQMTVVRKLQINGALNDAELTIPAEIRAQFYPDSPPVDLERRPLGNPNQPATELARGIVLIPGAWNIAMVRQDDGIVILEAPISSGYSAQAIAEAHRRFPGQPVKAVITTSDSWPHIAGIREYVAGGVEIYALDLNRPILERLIKAHRAEKPDALERARREPKFHLVRAKTVVGSGANALEIYPIRGETSERQMMIYFPGHRLLYGSDAFQRRKDGSFFYPQTITELQEAVKRERLTVDRFFMMHVGQTPWADLGKAVATAVAVDSPTGVL
jgi:hypothetical protein